MSQTTPEEGWEEKAAKVVSFVAFVALCLCAAGFDGWLILRSFGIAGPPPRNAVGVGTIFLQSVVLIIWAVKLAAGGKPRSPTA
jgi:hypothetical protein